MSGYDIPHDSKSYKALWNYQEDSCLQRNILLKFLKEHKLEDIFLIWFRENYTKEVEEEVESG